MDWKFLKNIDMSAYQVNSGKAFSRRRVRASKAKYVKKSKVIPLQAYVAQRVGRGIALLFLDRGTRRG